MDTNEKLVRTYARLKSLRLHLPQTLVSEEYVAQYHGILDSLGQLGFDVREWRIPDTWMSPISMSGNRKRYVAQGLLLLRLDEVLAAVNLTVGSGQHRAPGVGS